MNLFRNILRILVTFICLVAISSTSGAESLDETLVLKKGDTIFQHQESGDWSVVKILELDKWPDGTYTAHCLTYKRIDHKPIWSKIESLEVFALHAPIDAASFSSGWKLLGNSTPKDSELVGFKEYLKLTDFQRYVKVSKLDVNALVSEANVNYKKAIAANGKKNHEEAIILYSKAIDLFPMFYEAIDNRAFTYMDLGQYTKAMDDFQSSLQVNPNGLSAFFSIGECLLKLGQYADAMKVFKNGIVKFPEKESLFRDFYNKAEALGKSS